MYHQVEQLQILHSVHTGNLCFVRIPEQWLFFYAALVFPFYNRDGVCLLCGTNWIFTYNALTTKARFQYQASLWEICGGQRGTDTGFSPSALVLSCLWPFQYLFYRGADKSLARPTSRCILFDGENISFDTSLVIYINSTNIPPIMIINRIYEHQNLLSL
jgi:hypothetical protein